jgi:hypothetical protein
MRLLLVASVLATSLTPRPLAERAKAADRVAIVQVLSVKTEVVGGDHRHMLTHVEVLVGDVIKGPATETLTITQLGGRDGPWEAHVPGDATFVPGETALVLLKCRKDDTHCGLVGLNEGKVPLVGGDAFVYELHRKQYKRRAVVEVLGELRDAVKAVSR